MRSTDICSGDTCSAGRRRRGLVLAAAAALLLSLPSAGLASDGDFDAERTGHPLRMAAYIVYPIGFAMEWLLFRPAYWLGGHQPFKAVFGRTDAD